MKLISVALLMLSQLFGPANSSSVITDCKVICQGIRHTILGETHSSSLCNPALNLSPSPTVYKSCHNGRKNAYDKACVPLCSNKNTSISSFDASDSCKAFKGRGQSEYWCQRGFTSILKKLQDYSFPISDSITAQESQKEDKENEERPANVERLYAEPSSSVVELDREQEEVRTGEEEVEDNDLGPVDQDFHVPLLTDDGSHKEPESEHEERMLSIQVDVEHEDTPDAEEKEHYAEI
ncbi:hypothetical protein ACHAXM_012140 [Skeletonema potamos]